MAKVITLSNKFTHGSFVKIQKKRTKTLKVLSKINHFNGMAGHGVLIIVRQSLP